MKRRLVLRAILAGPAVVLAARDAAAEPPVFRDSQGQAVLGYDVVAFWTEKKAVLGNAANSFTWRGALWLFASPGNLALFAANPAKYAPEYGGHCAVSMASGKLTSIGEPAWSMVQGRLYFNYDKRVKETFDFRGTESFIKRADDNWKSKYGNL